MTSRKSDVKKMTDSREKWSKIASIGPTGIDYFTDLSAGNFATTREFAGGACRNIALNLCALRVDATLITQNYGNSLATHGFFTPSQINETYVNTAAEFLGWLGVYRASFDGLDIVDFHSEYEDSQSIFSESTAKELTPFLRSFDALISCSDVSEAFWFKVAPTLKRCLVTSGLPLPSSYLQWLNCCDLFFINREEASNLGLSPAALCQEARKRGVKNAFVTLGSEGGLYYIDERNQERHLAGPQPGPIISPVGAGDALVAGVICGLARHYSVEESAKLGLRAANLKLAYQGSAFTEEINL